MKTSTQVIAGLSVLGTVIALAVGVVHGQTVPAQALATQLKQGGYVLVMRHASSPRQTPDKQTANADNAKLERQLDEAGRTGAIAMGKAVRAMGIPVGELLSSPTYRALETARLAQLPNVRTHEELGDGGESMQGVSDAQGQWLRERASRLPKGTNTIIVTHMPNITRAFPDWGAVADGEAVVIGSDEKGVPRPLGRIKMEEWPSLR